MAGNKLVRCSIGNRVLCEKAYLATAWWERTRGLMFRKSIGPTDTIDGMLIEFCNSIHMFFMRFALDIIFLDRDNRVVKVLHNKKPWTMSWFYWRATKVLELPVGKGDNIQVGEQIRVEYV